MYSKNLFKQNKVAFVVASLFGMGLITSCDSDDSGSDSDPQVQIEPPIVLDCNYFTQNPNVVLQDNPNAPVDYIVTCKMAINDDVTIEPGVTIAFETDAGFRVYDSGSLKAVGNGNKQITLTGVDKSAGSWSGVFINSNDVKNEFAYVNVEYAGGSAFNSNGDKGGVIVYSGAQFKMSNSKISHSATYGLNANYGSTTLILNNNTYTQNNSPMRVRASLVGMVSGTDTYTGNTEDKVELDPYTAEITAPATIHKIGVPYKLVSSSSPILNIKSNVTIEPGVIIEMGSGTGIKVNDGASLKIEGTSSERIVIRGELAVAGSWGRIDYRHTQNPNNIIRYADIMHGGENPSSSKGAIYLWASPRLSIDNTNFSDILACAINGRIAAGGINYQSNLTVGANVTYTNCGGEICGD